jgi:hypothetical protein
MSGIREKSGKLEGTLALLGVLLLVIGATGCESGRSYAQAICVLVDVSGTYADEKDEVAMILKRDVLPGLLPGDTLLVIRIDSESYGKDNLEALMTLDARPSRANAQKLELARRLDAFARTRHASPHTDIQGAMMLGTDYLRELPSSSRVMLVFSDLEQDLPDGTRRSLEEGEFEGIEVVAMNVKRLQGDNADPGGFRARLTRWERDLRDAGATGWRTIMDSKQLPDHLSSLRGAV